MEKKVLFFSRSGYHSLFCRLESMKYQSYHAVLNSQEKERVQDMGAEVIGCFEELYDELSVASFPNTYLMNGFQPDRFMGRFSLQERRRVLGKLISFWRSVLGAKSFDAVVHDTISIEAEEVLSIEANRREVEDLTFLPSVVEGWFYWKPNPYNSSFPQEMLSGSEPSSRLQTIASQHVEGLLDEGHYPEYLDIEDSTYSPKMALRHLWKGLRKWVHKISSHRRVKSIHGKERLFYYNSYDATEQTQVEKFVDTIYATTNTYNSEEKCINKDFLFYPLHFEPEATLRYFAPKFSNQTGVIDLITRFLPTDKHLIVKEHPSQPYHLLRQKYAQLRRRNSNLLFLPASVPSEKLIEKCSAVVTISGTVGWEAAVYGRPVIVLGNVFYDKHPGVTSVDSVDGLRDALRGDVKNPVSKELTIEYLAKILSYSYPGKTHRDHWNDEGNLRKIQEGLVDRVCQ